MKFISTRGYDKKYSAAEAIVHGIAPDGGLFVPESLPVLNVSLIPFPILESVSIAIIPCFLK